MCFRSSYGCEQNDLQGSRWRVHPHLCASEGKVDRVSWTHGAGNATLLKRFISWFRIRGRWSHNASHAWEKATKTPCWASHANTQYQANSEKIIGRPGTENISIYDWSSQLCTRLVKLTPEKKFRPERDAVFYRLSHLGLKLATTTFKMVETLS